MSMRAKSDQEVLFEAEQLRRQNHEQLERQRRLIIGLSRTGGDVTEALAVLEDLIKIDDEQEGRLAYLRLWCGT